MAHRHCFQAVERSIRDATGDEVASRIVWVVSAEFCPVALIVRRSSVAQVVRSSLRKSQLWPSRERRQVTVNIRLQRLANASHAVEVSLFSSCARRVLSIDNGTVLRYNWLKPKGTDGTDRPTRGKGRAIADMDRKTSRYRDTFDGELAGPRPTASAHQIYPHESLVDRSSMSRRTTESSRKVIKSETLQTRTGDHSQQKINRSDPQKGKPPVCLIGTNETHQSQELPVETPMFSKWRNYATRTARRGATSRRIGGRRGCKRVFSR